jgi:hypothetical protein
MPRYYRLTEQILSVHISEDQGEKQIRYVPVGAIITVAEDHETSGNLIAVQWEKETVWMFGQDIESRTELLVEPLIAACVGSWPKTFVDRSRPGNPS